MARRSSTSQSGAALNSTTPLVPFSEYILKVHSRCNLACDYCYVYEHADQSWRRRPQVMSESTAAATVARIAEHVRQHRVARISVGLHGGEPLLAGHDMIERLIGRLREALDGACAWDLWVQTNGTLVDERFCELFLANGVSVGVSLDGDRAANDRHRRYANGRSSFEAVADGISLLGTERYREIFSGLLCTVDPENDPVEAYESLSSFRPPSVDLLLPHANWENPPPVDEGSATPYADWLIRVFDRWNSEHRPFPVRIFDSVIDTSLGGSSGVESMGLGPAEMVVVETDGTLEQADHLKSTYDGAAYTGLDVLSNDFDEAAAHPGIRARQNGLLGLAAECRACPMVTSCGGGLYAHRYRAVSGFDNPSVYCADLYKLVGHIRTAVGADGSGHATGAARVTRIPRASLEQLGRGHGDPAAVDQLKAGQRGLRRVLLGAVYHAAPADLSARRAWNTLTRADRSARAELGLVLGHPYMRTRAAHLLARTAAPDSGRGEPTGTASAVQVGALQRDVLVTLAAATAVRAGLPMDLRHRISSRDLYLPTLGRIVLPATGTAREIVLTSSGASMTFDAGGGAVVVLGTGADCGKAEVSGVGVRWERTPRRTVEGIDISLLDDDPYRDVYPHRAPPLASAADATGWWALLEPALALIRADYPAYWPGVAGVLTAVTPLVHRDSRTQVSATSRDAFGVIGLAAPPDPETLALLILHEIQHAKLGAVLDLVDLYDEEDDRLYRVPWREDPRPLEGLLQGTYAHLAVADFWRVRGGRTSGKQRLAAQRQYLYWRRATQQGTETLLRSGSLSQTGTEFTRHLRSTMAGWT